MYTGHANAGASGSASVGGVAVRGGVARARVHRRGPSLGFRFPASPCLCAGATSSSGRGGCGWGLEAIQVA
eukprot:7548441-Lingulodinium_polyedra.AAC.1